jgi:hypothetical protein
MVLAPMVEEGKEAVGSMGDDTPLAVLSEKYRPLSHFFRQNFSQVTNPPIDPLRETGVMSLKTRFKNLGNILAQDAAPDRRLRAGKPGADHRHVRAHPRPAGREERRGHRLHHALARRPKRAAATPCAPTSTASAPRPRTPCCAAAAPSS